MNYQYLRRNYATDVLSFAYKGEVMEGMRFLGEIIIAPEIAVRQADPERELRKLLIHGILHLLGYDHEAAGPARRMEALETRILASLGVADPYRVGEDANG